MKDIVNKSNEIVIDKDFQNADAHARTYCHDRTKSAKMFDKILRQGLASRSN